MYIHSFPARGSGWKYFFRQVEFLRLSFWAPHHDTLWHWNVFRCLTGDSFWQVKTPEHSSSFHFYWLGINLLRITSPFINSSQLNCAHYIWANTVYQTLSLHQSLLFKKLLHPLFALDASDACLCKAKCPCPANGQTFQTMVHLSPGLILPHVTIVFAVCANMHLVNFNHDSVQSVSVCLVIPVKLWGCWSCCLFLFPFLGSPADLLMSDVMVSVCLLIYALMLLSTTYVVDSRQWCVQWYLLWITFL